MTTALFTPFTIRDVTFRNRLWVSPMCQYSCEDQDGVPTDWHLVHLGSFARGGAGLIVAEASGVVPEGRITPWCTGIWDEAQRDSWARIVDFIHSQGAKAGIQLAHAGRKGSTHREWSGKGSVPLPDGGWTAVAPSPIAFPGYADPRELTADEIEQLPAAWAASARLALDAGFDVLEVHAAHGYLLHEFLSPLSNTRTDEYGGSLENRARLLLAVIRAVRAEAGEGVPVFVRLSATDWSEPDGWTIDDTVAVSEWAKEAGADLVDVSSGGLVAGVHIPTSPGYQVRFASAVRTGAHVPTGAVGQIVGAHQAEQVIASGDADAVFVGREFLRDPHLPLRVAHELGEELDYWPKPYTRADFSQRPNVA
ncbi:NADH:flavin oxidoreductase/NADH oxidase [Demequina sp.]|uniref:NADH:flavin oxidoreductase/NADH oxidase n=1 Tax=Demequina sp. TaxID=2050685 RepID=UPI003D11A4B2